MAIIAISRELAALGDETAHTLAEKLKYKFVDKTVIEERINTLGGSSCKFDKYDEKKPSFWASISNGRDDYLHFLKSAVFAEAEHGNAVFMGRGAGILLKNVPGVFSVFLAAPLEIRVERVKSYFHCDEKKARQIIEHSDHAREGFHRFFFGTKWNDAGNYHLALNTWHLHPELCSEIIKSMRDGLLTEDMAVLGRQRIKELTIGQAVKHCISYEKKLQIHFLEVSVTNGKVILYGATKAQSFVEDAITYAMELTPDFTVQSEIQLVQEYSVIP